MRYKMMLEGFLLFMFPLLFNLPSTFYSTIYRLSSIVYLLPSVFYLLSSAFLQSYYSYLYYNKEMASKHARRSRASKKGGSPSPSPTPRSPQTPPTEPSKADSPPPMSYANSLLPEAERLKRQGRVAAQVAQQTRIKADPEQYWDKLTDLEKATPGMTHFSLLY